MLEVTESSNSRLFSQTAISQNIFQMPITDKMSDGGNSITQRGSRPVPQQEVLQGTQEQQSPSQPVCNLQPFHLC